jgi:hypothetical protein
LKKKDFILGSQIPIPPPVKEWAESLKTTAGVYATRYRGHPAYLVAAGECRTGGFSVAVHSMRGEPSVLAYEIKKPSDGDFVIQVITYPYELVFPGKDKPLSFRMIGRGSTTEVIIRETPALE